MCADIGSRIGRCIGLLLAAFLIIVLVSSCGSRDILVQEDEDKIILEIYAWQNEEYNMELLADEYMKENPNIEIQLNFIPISEYTQQMQILKKRGQQVDCIFCPTTASILVLENKGIIKNIDSYLELENYESCHSEWYGEEDEECHSYMLPYRISKWAVYYNKTLFDKMGVEYPEKSWTWQDYEDIAVALTGELDGIKTYGSLSFDPKSIWWRIPARSRGANDPLNAEHIMEFRRSAEWFYHLTYDLKAQMPYYDMTGNIGLGYDALFLNGNIGMYFSGDWSMTGLNREIEKNYPDFEYDIAPIPHYEGSESYVISDAAVGAVAEASLYPDEAFKFLEFVSGYKGARLLALNSVIPAWKSQEVIDIFNESASMPEHKEYFFIEGIVSRNPSTVYYDAAMQIIKDEVALYLLQEHDIEQAFINIQKELEHLE